MGKTQQQRKNDQRSKKRKQNKQKPQQQRTKKSETAPENDQRSAYILNEKVVELGGEQPEAKQSERTPKTQADETTVKTEKAVEQTSAEVEEAEILETKVASRSEPVEAEIVDAKSDEPSDEPKQERSWDWRAKLHRLNGDYPWLKIVGVIILTLLMLGGVGWALAGGQGSQEVDSTEIAGEEGSDQETENKDGQGGAAQPPEEQSPEVVKPEPEPEANAGQNTEVPPAPQRPAKEVVPGSKLIALTFDDGPSGATTPRLLDILAQKQVKATFFVLGSMAQRAPDLVQREEAEGHEIGSHTPWHDNLANLGAAEIQRQVATMQQILGGILGHGPAFTRPPYGAVNQAVKDNLGQPLILWSVDPEDWKYRNAATVRRNVVGAAFDGAIVLLHDIHASTVEAVAGIIDDLRAQGYEFLTVSELARARGVTLANGVIYYYFKP